MGYCPFEHWLGWAQGMRHGTGAGARAARAQGRWARRDAGAGARQAGRRRRWGAGVGMLGRAAGRRGGRAARALGARAGQGCALGALSLFLSRFDSILFLSQFLDIVREPGS